MLQKMFGHLLRWEKTVLWHKKDVSPFVTSETTFLTSCLLSCTPNPEKKSNRKRITLNGEQVISFRVYIILKGRQKQFS